MTNDAKFGMLAGVLGVVVAGLLSSRVPDAPPTVAKSKEATKPAAQIAPRAALPEAPAPRAASATELQGTPVVRTRKEPTAQPASRPTAWDEEP